MSDGTQPEFVDPAGDDAAFAFIMDTVAAEPDAAEAAAAAAPDGAPVPGAGSQPAPGEGTVAPAAGAPAPDAGAGGGAAVPGEPGVNAAPAAGVEPGAAAPGYDSAQLNTHFGTVSTGIEKRLSDDTQNAVLSEVREEYDKYFEAIEQHPRLLIGKEVPSITGEGMETLRDSADAKEWQEAVRQQLIAEVRDRVSRRTDDNRPLQEVLHNSVRLFQDNPDLIPDGPQFDRELVDRFAAQVAPYAMKVNGKTVGYQVPVQPFVDSVRAQLKAERAAAPAPAAVPGTPTAQQQRAAEQARTAAGQFTGPQAGIPSQAGVSGQEGDDFSTLFGTLGLPTLRI